MDGNSRSLYGPTKGERREKARDKERERMDQGKRVKLIVSLIQRRAQEAEKKLRDRMSGSESGN